MSTENETVEVKESTEKATPEASNRDVKDSPLFQKLTAELSSFKQREAERQEADKSAQSKAEQEKLEAAGRYEEALALKQKEFENLQAKHQKEVLKRDLKTELIQKGFNNEIFMKGAMAAFEGDSDSVADYVNELASADSNKMFLTDSNKRTVLPVPNGVNPFEGVTDWGKIREIAKGSDKDSSQKAKKALTDYYDKNGSFPPR